MRTHGRASLPLNKPLFVEVLLCVHVAMVFSQVQGELARRGAKVTVAVFWGRERYVSLLWRYLERNLAVNHGIVHEVQCQCVVALHCASVPPVSLHFGTLPARATRPQVLLITNDRDSPQGAMGAEAVLQAATAKCVACRCHSPALSWRAWLERVHLGVVMMFVSRLGGGRYPSIVKRVPFCPKAYGCAFDEILVDPHAIYVKLDDDILFIKDGSVEHLVYQVREGPSKGGQDSEPRDRTAPPSSSSHTAVSSGYLRRLPPPPSLCPLGLYLRSCSTRTICSTRVPW